MSRTLSASKRSALLRLLKPESPANRFSFLCHLSIDADLPPTSTPPETEPTKSEKETETQAKDEAVVTQVVHLLQSSDDDWNGDELRRLLFAETPCSPRCLFQITRRLDSTIKALRFLEWLLSDSQSSQDFPSLSSVFQVIFELANRETDSQSRLFELFTKSKECNVPLTVNSATLLLRCFGRARMIDESLAVYNELDPCLRNTRVRNLMIGVLMRVGRFDDALRVLDDMLQPNAEFPPNESTGDIVFFALLKMDKLGRSARGEEVVGLVSKFGEHCIFPSSMRLTQLITKLCKSGRTNCAWDVLHDVLRRGGPVGAPSCNALLTGLGRCRDVQRMNSLLTEMKEVNIQPDAVTLGILINHLCKFQRVDEALEVFKKMVEEVSNGVSVVPDVVIFNTLIDGLCKVGRQEEGLGLMEIMNPHHSCVPNTVTYNCLINGFCRAGEIERSQELFNEMNRKGVPSNVITLNTLVDGMCRHGRVNSAIGFFKEVEEKGLKGNTVTYTILIKAFCSANNINKAMELFDELLKAECSVDAIVYYTLISGLTQAGRMDDASYVASKLKEAGFGLDIVCYNILIGGFCKKNKLDEAYKMLKEMEDAKVKPDGITYNTLISFFCKNGDFTTARRLMKKMTDGGLVPTVVTYGAMIHAYCLYGNLDGALKIYRDMSSSSRVPPNTVIYNILMNSLCKNNDVETALTLLDDMKVKEVRPNTNTYNAIFKGLKEKNMLDKAFVLMDRMNEEACNPDYITMEVLTEWLSAVGEPGKLRSFVEGFDVCASSA